MPMTCERNLCPTGEGHEGTGPSSRYEGRVFQPLLHCAQEKRWVTTNLGSAHLDAQDAHAEPRLRMHPSPSSVCSIDLKTRTSMCRSFRATGHSCGLRSKDEHISTGPALRAVPIAPCLHESSGGSPCSLERTGRAHSQLPRRLAHTGSVSGSVMRTLSGVWTGPQLHWHINCLELLAVHLALNRLKRRLRGEHVLVRMDSTATIAYINRQGGLRSHRMSQLARHLLLWSRKHLRLLRAIHILGLLNRTGRRAALPGEWRLHPQTVQLICDVLDSHR